MAITVKNKIGRPKTTVKERIEEKYFDLEVIRKLAIHGLTDEELGDILNVSQRTIDNWKKDSEFLSVLKKGKLDADLEVEKSLYKRAIGFDYEEIQTEGVNDGGEKLRIKSVKKTKKCFAPDTAAAFIWLKNRRGWKDTQKIELSGSIEERIRNMTEEQRQKRIKELKAKLIK